MRYLFLMSVGPVQGFIAASRKLRDLAVGSWIVSELAKSTAKKFSPSNLIFPFAEARDLEDKSFHASNKILAFADTDDPRMFAKEAKGLGLERLLELGRTLEVRRGLQYDATRLAAHLGELYEFYAAWHPCDADSGLATARPGVERSFNSRKTLNAFSAHEGLSGRYKSSLDGGRESIIDGRGKTQSPADLIRLREEEHLDGAAFLKRFLKHEVRFESTTEAAVLPYLKRVERKAVEDPDLASELAAIRTLNGKAGLRADSGALLFDFESRDVFGDPADDADLKRARGAIQEKAGKPTAPYYAVMTADGDSMGERLADLTLEDVRTFSIDLSKTARTLRERLSEIECMPVFTGGDEVLAILPLHRVREAAWMVRDSFADIRAGGKKITISAGIAIVHALDPLDDARDHADAAARKAKAVEGKDAVCISVHPRSGSSVEASGHWEEMGRVLSRITTALANDGLSFGFAHELRALLARTGHPAMRRAIDPILPAMAASLARRKNKADSAAPDLVAEATDRRQLQDLAERMLVGRKLAKAERDAAMHEVTAN